MFQHIKKLLLGNGLAQGIQLLSLLVLSRLYTPSDFGLLAQVQAIATFSTIIATLQLHLATPLSQSDAEARKLTSHTQSIAVALTLGLFIPAIALGHLEAYSLLLTLAIALINTYNGYLIYRGDFSAISRFYITRACLVVTFQLLFALLGFADGLVLGTLLAEALAALYLLHAGLDHRPALSLNPRPLGVTIRQHKAFSLYGTSQELISVSAFYAPLILFGFYFDAATAGQYAMASRLVWAPTVLLSKNIAQVFYHVFAQPKNVQVGALTSQYLKKKAVIALGIVCTLIATSKEATNIILGDNWILASETVPVISIWALAFLIATPYRVLYRTLKLQKILLLFDATFLITIALIFQYLNTESDIVTAIAIGGTTLQLISAAFIYLKAQVIAETDRS